VYGIIRQNGGDVQIYSSPGIGTSFLIMLPATDEKPDTPPDADGGAAGAPRLGHGETVLLVEDETSIREVAHRILHRSGYQVLVAATGVEALQLAENYRGEIALLITDVVMPRMQGREVAQRLLARRPGMRVLYVSGYSRPVLADTGIVNQESVLLEKPFSENALLAAVGQVLDEPAGSPSA
jgi:CheY-like chemotaxis protein